MIIYCVPCFCFTQCIVKSYLNWLQDSDYNPVCTLCNGSLAEGDVVRLICFGKEQNVFILAIAVVKQNSKHNAKSH